MQSAGKITRKSVILKKVSLILYKGILGKINYNKSFPAVQSTGQSKWKSVI